jgi:hypothetical protein
VFVTIASVYGLVKWFCYSLGARTNFVCRFLKANEIRYNPSSSSSLSSTGLDHDESIPVKRLDEFVQSYCRQDGILLLRLMKKNTNNVIAGEVICALWENWKGLAQVRFNASSADSDNGGQVMGLGVKHPLKQLDIGEVNEKLLSP